MRRILTKVSWEVKKQPIQKEIKPDNNLVMYSSCRCGSGKKYKFCCWEEDKRN